MLADERLFRLMQLGAMCTAQRMQRAEANVSPADDRAQHMEGMSTAPPPLFPQDKHAFRTWFLHIKRHYMQRQALWVLKTTTLMKESKIWPSTAARSDLRQ
jgi:hypothetical protein